MGASPIFVPKPMSTKTNAARSQTGSRAAAWTIMSSITRDRPPASPEVPDVPDVADINVARDRVVAHHDETGSPVEGRAKPGDILAGERGGEDTGHRKPE